MLILSRKKDESIIIDGNIELTIIEVKDNQVRIGINAPKNIPVHRKEVYQEIQQQAKEASLSSPEDLDSLF